MTAGGVDVMIGRDLPGFTYKLDIGQSSIYVTTAWLCGKIINISITLSRGGKDSLDYLPRSHVQANLELRVYDLARSWVEDSCKLASMLLETGTPMSKIIESWRGVRGYPSGVCPQLQIANAVGPLHAAAVLIEKKMPEWAEKLYGEEED